MELTKIQENSLYNILKEIKKFSYQNKSSRTIALINKDEFFNSLKELFKTLDGGGTYDLNLFKTTPTELSIISDLIISIINVNCASYYGKEKFGNLEYETIKSISNAFNFERELGFFIPGSSYANFQSIAILRDNVIRNKKKPVVIYSSEAHFSIERTINLLNIQGIKVPVLLSGEININKVEKVIKTLASNEIPIVVSTFGTTSCGSLDDINSICEIGKRYKILHHIDAAYGGVALLDDEYSQLYREAFINADTVSIDFHKWLLTPNTTAVLFIKSSSDARNAFAISDWTNYNESIPEPYLHLFSVSRRADFLRLWLPLKVYGWDFFVKHVNNCIQNSTTFKNLLEKNGIQVFKSNSKLPTICFKYNSLNKNNFECYISKFNKEGLSIGATYINKDLWLRCSLTSDEINESDIEEIIKILNKHY